MRIEQLEYVLAVARYGSLSRASAIIYIGQPTLSSAISSLERELGHDLFRRTRRGMVLTRFGEDLLPLIERTVTDFYAIKKRAGTGAPTLSHLHLLAASATRDVMVKAVERSQHIFPTVHYYLHQALSGDVLHHLAENKAAIGLSLAVDYQLQRHRDYADNLNLRFHPLYNDNLVLFCKSGSPLDHLESLSFDELALHGTVAIPTDLVHPGALKTHSQWTSVAGHLAFDDPAALAQYVSQGESLGVTTLLSTTVDPLFLTGYFKPLRLTGCPINVVHYLAYRRNPAITDEEADIIQEIESLYEHFNLS